MSSSLAFHPLIPLKSPLKSCANTLLPIITPKSHTTRRKSSRISCTNSRETPNQEQLNLSVLRFTLGIPGLDESYLPRWIGYAFGSLLLLNHFVGSSSAIISPAQLRTEALGLSLAAFSVVLPFLGKFLKGATPVNQKVIPEGAEQIFIMSQDISDSIKEDLAWGTFILLRNTNTISVLISVQGALCVRGYWNTPEDLSKIQALDWFEKQSQQIGLSNLKYTLYFPQTTDSEFWQMLPKGTRSVLVQPVLQTPGQRTNGEEETIGFVLLASSISYSFSTKDRSWIGAIANKYRAGVLCGVNILAAFTFQKSAYSKPVANPTGEWKKTIHVADPN